MGTRQWLSVGRVDVRMGSGGRAPRGAAVGARERLWCEGTYQCVAWDGHLEVLKWARANGCPWNDWTREKAATMGYFEVAQSA